MLAIAAQINTSELGTNYFQETHPEHLFAQCSHYCATVTDAAQMPRLLEVAIRHAVSQRGVSVLIVPGDIALKEAPNPKPRLSFPEPTFSVWPSNTDLDRLADLLNSSEKVTILGGAGCADAHAELIALAKKLCAPIVHALRGKEYIEYDNPFDVGMTGLLGSPAGYRAIMACDTLLMVGTDFPYAQFYPEHAKIAQIDIRGEQIGRRCKIDLAVVGDAKTTLEKLLPKIQGGRATKHLTSSLEQHREDREDLDGQAPDHGLPGVIHPQHLTKVINEKASGDAIFTCDVRTPTVWAARYLTMNGRRRLVGSFCHGSMASALPQAIGAQLAYPDRQVIALCGDGGLAMCLGDLLSLRQLELPVKVIVYRNDALAFVEMEMKAAGILDFATDLVNPDFAMIGKASGLLAIKANETFEVEAAIEQALAYKGPAIVEVAVARQELSMPPTITFEQAKGMGIFMLKAVLSGRGNEVIDLAKTNFLH